MTVRGAAACVLLAGVALAAQDIISAKAGYLNYQEGRFTGRSRQLQEGESFRAERGRAEFLLTPGAFLRLERNAEIRMLSTALNDPHVELVQGLIGLEVSELPKKASVNVAWGDYRDTRAIAIESKGLYRFRVAEDRLWVAVQDGSLILPGAWLGARTGSASKLKRGQMAEISAGGIQSMAKFDRKLMDSFDLWSSRRAAQLSQASYRQARNLSSSRWPGGAWAFNPWLGGFTYLPYSTIASPWGYSFYSPRNIWVYLPGNNSGGNYSGPITPSPGSGSMGASAPRESISLPAPSHPPAATVDRGKPVSQ